MVSIAACTLRTIAIACTLLLALASNPLSAAQPPNIVLILSDDQAWNDYGFMGHAHIDTPNLDKLAAQSVVFRRGYVPTGLCRPSLMTLVTGHYASQHGVTGNDPSPKYTAPGSPEYAQLRADLIAKIDNFETLPELLSKRGYLSHQSGKWWEGNFARGGFTHGMTRGFPLKGGRHGDDGLDIGRKGMVEVTEFIDLAVEQEKPFFVWYAPFMPHTPHTPPQRILAKYTAQNLPVPVAKYYAMCEWFDETCGTLVNHIDSSGIRENTLIVYVTDNGWIQDPEKNGYAPRSKQTPYEGGVRTPILFSWPGHLEPADRPELISSIDIYPTLAAAAGGAPPSDLPGINLLPELETGAAITRESIFGESFAHDIVDINDPEKTLLYRWCISGKWKLLLTYDGEVNRYASTHPRTDRRPQLFDLIADPSEQHNVAADQPSVVAELTARIAAWYPVEAQ